MALEEVLIMGCGYFLVTFKYVVVQNVVSSVQKDCSIGVDWGYFDDFLIFEIIRALLKNLSLLLQQLVFFLKFQFQMSILVWWVIWICRVVFCLQIVAIDLFEILFYMLLQQQD
eukprot:TRINITY_DN12282_c0_g1_i4.p1 TRINITY_DN12282_c0_g1~~TRINITY_DN12282_c0_g1_i4.p1  ORF type:complete len:114 (-),score=5.68 TRINITY_DN12282_c0_g1_i4:113-454(-)